MANLDEVIIVNISNPANPVQVGNLEIGGEFHDFHVTGTHVLIASGNSGSGVFDARSGCLLGIVSSKVGSIGPDLEAFLDSPGGVEVSDGRVGLRETQRKALERLKLLFAPGYGWAVGVRHVREILGP